MSRRRTFQGGIMPVDTLSSSPAREEVESPKHNLKPRKLSPVRYRKKRDPKVVAELDQMGSEIFSIDAKRPNDGGRKRETREEENSLLKRRRRELLISDDVIEDNNHGNNSVMRNGDSIRYTLLGSVSLLDVSQSEVEIEHTIMNFVNEKAEFRPIVKFHSRDHSVDEFQLDLIHNCKKLWFTQSMTTVGFLLNKEINISIRSMSTRISAKCVVWTSNQYLDSKSPRLGQIKQILEFLNDNKQSLGSSIKIIKNLSELEFRRCIKSQVREETEIIKNSEDTYHGKSDRLHKFDKNLSSLQILKKFSKRKDNAIRKGTIHSHRISNPIRVPHDRYEPSKSNNHRLNDSAIEPIPSSGFYSRSSTVQKDNKGENKLSDHLLSNVRKTRSKNSTSQDSTSINIENDEDMEYETPKLFKPNLNYKFPDGSSYTITNQDFRCLYNQDWINDSIIDFFTKFFIEASIEQEKVERDQVHVMSSFFYTKLISTDKDVYQNVKKWVQNTDLFSKKYVVIPINMNYHWFGCIITNLEIYLKYHLESNVGDQNENEVDSKGDADEELSVSSPIITILTFDSLKQTHTKEIDPIKEFLVSYAKDKYNIDIEKAYVKMKTCAVPQQPNFSDCGIHLILNNKKFFESPKETLEVWYSNKVKSRANMKNINTYFDKMERGSARKSLRDILLFLQEEQIQLNKGNDQNRNDSSTKYNEDENDDEEIEIIEDYTKVSKNRDDKISSIEEQPESDNDMNRLQSLRSDPPDDVSLNNEERPKKDEFIDKTISCIAKETGGSEHISNREDDCNNGNMESTPEKAMDLNNSTKIYTSPYFGKSLLKERTSKYIDSTNHAENDNHSTHKSRDGNVVAYAVPESKSEPDENDDYSERYNDSDVSLIRDNTTSIAVSNRTDSLESLRSNVARELKDDLSNMND